MSSTTQTNLSDNTAPSSNKFAVPSSRKSGTKLDVLAAAVLLVLTCFAVARTQDMRSEPADAAAAPIVLTPDAIIEICINGLQLCGSADVQDDV
jgi:hypothetical protein